MWGDDNIQSTLDFHVFFLCFVSFFFFSNPTPCKEGRLIRDFPFSFPFHPCFFFSLHSFFLREREGEGRKEVSSEREKKKVETQVVLQLHCRVQPTMMINGWAFFFFFFVKGGAGIKKIMYYFCHWYLENSKTRKTELFLLLLSFFFFQDMQQTRTRYQTFVKCSDLFYAPICLISITRDKKNKLTVGLWLV